jgi:ANTAR domain-containing protein
VVRVDGGVESLGVERESGGAGDPDEVLRHQIRNLEAAMESQRLIGVAIGLVAQRAGCSVDDAWQQLVRVSQDRNVKVREIARILVDARNGRAEPTDAATLADVASRLVCGRASQEQ